MGQKHYKRERGLTIKQKNAIDLLVTGKSDQAVADAVGVSRVTVTCWRLEDTLFRAELNKRRKEIWGASVDRLRSLLPKAFDALEKAMDEGSVRAALGLVRLAGLNELLPEIGPDNEHDVRQADDQCAWDNARERMLKACCNAPVAKWMLENELTDEKLGLKHNTRKKKTTRKNTTPDSKEEPQEDRENTQ
jgi:hypothetical protein